MWAGRAAGVARLRDLLVRHAGAALRGPIRNCALRAPRDLQLLAETDRAHTRSDLDPARESEQTFIGLLYGSGQRLVSCEMLAASPRSA